MNVDVRDNWRVLALVVLLLLSTYALFAPQGGASNAPGASAANDSAVTSSGPTNLQYGLQLSGGSRLRAPITGWTATGVDVPQEQSAVAELERAVAAELNATRSDVKVRPQLNTVEVFLDVPKSRAVQAFRDAGLSPETVRPGVTEPTRTNVVETLQAKIDATGFSGATVQVAEAASGVHYVVIEVPNKPPEEVRELVTGRGTVSLVAYFPRNGQQVNETVLVREDIETVGQPTTVEGQPAVPVTLTEQAGERFQQDMRQYGFTSAEATSNCDFQKANDTDYCLLTVRDGNVVYSAGVRQNLQSSWQSGEFAKSPNFVITATSMDEARKLYVDLNAGALPAPLDVENGTSYYLQPSLAERFKTNSLVTGLVAAAAVAVVIFLRYGRREVAAPMFVTALSEVYILLGFAAASGLALDLSHIAGLIAVIGTGVDDLVIIADEVLTEQVSSSRVFQSRFRKALWIIGAAAATTIIAMSPLAVLSLGDLRGFAIITILGVIVGVVITRPAYGDILRSLVTGEH